MRALALTLLLGSITVVPSVAQTANVRILLPVIATNVSGAFGSTWKTDLFVFNNSDASVTVSYPQQCNALCTNATTLFAQHGDDLTTLTPNPGSPAALIYVPATSRDAVEFTLRVRDLSQQADSWGAEIPVVYEDQAFARSFDLLDVPLLPRFRQMLRMYDVAATGSSTVTVQYFAMDNNQLLREQTVPLQFTNSGLPFSPAYAEVAQFSSASELAGLDRVRIRITPTNAAQRLWAMVSVTNNVTQELTIISPQ